MEESVQGAPSKTPEQLAALHSEVVNDPAGRGYAAYIADAPGMVLELLNDTQGGHMYRSHAITARQVIVMPLGISILEKLEQAAVSNVAVKWAVRFLDSTAGLDIGHPFTHAMIDQLVAAPLFTQAEADALKALSYLPASRAEIIGFGSVSYEDLAAAMEEGAA